MGMNLLLSDVVPLLLANQFTGVFHKIFSSPFIIRNMYGFISSYVWMGTSFLYSFIENNLRPFSLKFYDFNWYEELVRHGDLALSDALDQEIRVPVKGKIQNPDQFNRLEAQNIANYYLLMLRATRKIQYMSYVNINHELLEILRKEYHLQ